MFAVDDDPVALLMSCAFCLRLTWIENRSRRIRNQRSIGELVDESLEPRHEFGALADRAGINRHVELSQVRFSGRGEEADDVGTKRSAGENPGEERDAQREAVAFVAGSRVRAARRW